MTHVLELLIVEDAEQDAALMIRELKKGGLDPHSTRVASAKALREALDKQRWDLVLADFELPSFDAFAALEIVREADAELPCIVVSGRIGEEVAVQAMRAGAQDFVPKDRLLRLAPVALRELKDAEGRRAQARDARRIAAQHATAALLASGRPVRESMCDLLRAIGEHLGWRVAALWEWHESAQTLRCVATWGEAPALMSEARELALSAEVDLPGRVIETGGPVWVEDYALDPTLPRAAAARRDGLRGACAVPIRIDGALTSVLALFSASPEKEDPGTLSALDTLASQIGQAMGRERALEALRESEARKAAVLETALDAVITIDHKSRILEFNPAAERIFGYAKHEAIGKDMAELLVPSSLRGAHRRGLARYLTTGEGPMLGRRVELPALRKDGSEFPAEIAITRVSTSGDPVFTGFVRDMTKSVALIGALQAAEARQRVLAEVGAALVQSLDHATALPRVAVLLVAELCDWCAIHLLDEAGQLSQVAAAHRDPQKIPLLEQLWRRRPPSPDCEVGPARVTRTGSAQVITRVSDADLARIARDEEERRLLNELGSGSYLGVPLSARGATLGTLSVVRAPGPRSFGPEDRELTGEIARRCATAIDNALLYREAQESLRARDDFLVLAAHELSTPLTPLRMRVQELSRVVAERGRDCPAAAQLEEEVRAIDRSSRRLAELVDRLLDVSRVTVGKLALERERFDAVALVRQVVTQLTEELDRAGSRVTFSVPDHPVPVLWDRRRIQVALHNLLSNALKFGPGRPIEVSVREQDEEVHMAVSDQGPGLTPEDRGRLFERFARVAPVRQYGGFGLGLWIVRQIAEEHGGRVEVWSEPGEGARFGLTLPRE